MNEDLRTEPQRHASDQTAHAYLIIDTEQDLSNVDKSDLVLLFPGYTHHLPCPCRSGVTRVYMRRVDEPPLLDSG